MPCNPPRPAPAGSGPGTVWPAAPGTRRWPAAGAGPPRAAGRSGAAAGRGPAAAGPRTPGSAGRRPTRHRSRSPGPGGCRPAARSHLAARPGPGPAIGLAGVFAQLVQGTSAAGSAWPGTDQALSQQRPPERGQGPGPGIGRRLVGVGPQRVGHPQVVTSRLSNQGLGHRRVQTLVRVVQAGGDLAGQPGVPVSFLGLAAASGPTPPPGAAAAAGSGGRESRRRRKPARWSAGRRPTVRSGAEPGPDRRTASGPA